MQIDRHQREAKKTWNNHKIHMDVQPLVVALLGLNSEAGEVTDIIKKLIYSGYPNHRPLSLDERREIVKECGDVYYYLAIILEEIEVDPSKVLQQNINKLRERHGESFNQDHYKEKVNG